MWSLFQSMGWNNPRFNKWRRSVATGLATVVVVGNVSFPIMTLAGVIEYDETAVTHSAYVGADVVETETP
jgi:succinate dehydrogenase / fumarate reductase cytochrome b subunit